MHHCFEDHIHGSAIVLSVSSLTITLNWIRYWRGMLYIEFTTLMYLSSAAFAFAANVNVDLIKAAQLCHNRLCISTMIQRDVGSLRRLMARDGCAMAAVMLSG